MISEERAEKAVEYLRDTADEYGQLCGQVELYAHNIKVYKGMAFLLSTEGTVAEREATAWLDPKVRDAIKDHSNAVAQKQTLSTKRKAAELTIDVWRSQNSTNRAKML